MPNSLSEIRNADTIRSNANSASPGNGTMEAMLTVIAPPQGWHFVDVQEVWRFRELLYFLTWRDVKIRYKQTVLGAAWAILQPLLMMVVFTIVLHRMARVQTGDVPYPLFAYSGLLVWSFFATAVTNAANSVVGSESMVTKIYFPRLLIPMASVGAALVDFLAAFGMLLVLMAYYGFLPTASMLLVVPALLIAALAALGVGAGIAALNVSYRDFRYVVPFMIQLWMFATPIIYMNTAAPAAAATDNVRESAGATAAANEPAGAQRQIASNSSSAAVPQTSVLGQVLLHVNPLIPIIGFFRAAVLSEPLPWAGLAVASGLVGLFLLAGLSFFKAVESSFADVI